MEQFLLSNAARHQSLVKAFKAKTHSSPDDDAITSPNIVVATRIRPMLDHELSSGQVVAAFPRDGNGGVVDLHELKRTVRGPPTLNVSIIHFNRSLHCYLG